MPQRFRCGGGFRSANIAATIFMIKGLHAIHSVAEAWFAETQVPPDTLPDFQEALLLSGGGLNAPDLSECHGVLCGMICRDGGGDMKEFLSNLEEMQLGVAAGSALHSVMEEAFHSTREQLSDDQFRFRLWLPDDDRPLQERTRSVAQWCTGFLAGLGLGGPLESMSEEAGEALEDLKEIAQAGFDVGFELTDVFEPDDEDETAYTEIVEYVRVATLILHEELRGPEIDDPIH